MILKSITPKHFGPFGDDAKLELDPEVTVLTGPNDVGKSLALRAIEILCTKSSAAEHEINRHRMRQFNGQWKDDVEIVCRADFEITELAKQHHKIPTDWPAGGIVAVEKRMNVPGAEVMAKEFRVKSRTTNSPASLNRMPTIVSVGNVAAVRQVLTLSKLNDAETALIQLGFGRGFNIDTHKALDPFERSSRIREAEETLNDRLRDLFPTTMPINVNLTEVAGESESLGIGIVDSHRAYTPLGSRGAGVQRLLSVVGALLGIDTEMRHAIILYDEPELSLHADAQHALRRLLESLASNPAIQVVYSTHSPAMINTLRPGSIRVVERTRIKNSPFARFENSVYRENYSLVRSSLGVTPADSLLYSPITLIAEGPTEVLCVPLVLKKLCDANLINAELFQRLIPDVHILDGEGAKFEYMCRLAKSQHAKPVIFVDGDKERELNDCRNKHPEVPIIALDNGKEFEDVIPLSRYIEAAQSLLETEVVTEATFTEWVGRTKPKPKLLTSKRVERWLEDDFGISLSKPRLMEKAIELTDAQEINSEPFRRLMDRMSEIAKSL